MRSMCCRRLSSKYSVEEGTADTCQTLGVLMELLLIMGQPMKLVAISRLLGRPCSNYIAPPAITKQLKEDRPTDCVRQCRPRPVSATAIDLMSNERSAGL